MRMELKVSKSLLKKIELGDKFTITCIGKKGKAVKGRKIKQTLTVNGICSTGIIDLS